MRYVAEYISPATGQVTLGTTTRLVRKYKDDRNALRFMHLHLRGAQFPAGQYMVSTFPQPGVASASQHIGYLYKRAGS